MPKFVLAILLFVIFSLLHVAPQQKIGLDIVWPITAVAIAVAIALLPIKRGRQRREETE